jgi:hypothetical protein
MKQSIGCLAVLILASGCGWAGTVTETLSVNPVQTFLYQSANDTNAGALFINLTGFAPAGSTLTIVGLGDECVGAGGTDCAPEELGGVFDTNNVLLNSTSLTGGNVDRLTGTLNAAGTVDVANLSYFDTYYVCTPVTSTTNCVAGDPGTDTTIPNDFLIPTGNGLTVLVPTGAQYLVIGSFDSFFGDNTDPMNNLAVQLTDVQLTAPEPATLGLFGAGFVGLALLRRYRSR